MMLILIMIVLFPSRSAWAFCFEEVSRRYGISPHLLKAIARVESNMQPHAINHNKNGSVDYCHMQINSYWKKHLKERWQYLNDPCYCTMVGAWILKQCINRYGYNPNALVCYHTGKSLPELSSARRGEAVTYLEKINHSIKKFAGLP
ncbi:MAG: lytic transglycosylase domain-containing protein [Desulfobacterales bacterium]|nr:lytic transglycosylase domain-containing protein [Desulfobacterales bacterium]